jgi:hypothetical protein
MNKFRLIKSKILKFMGMMVLSNFFIILRIEAAPSQLMDYFMPTPITGSLSSTCWGAKQVGSRDQSNGLEDTTLSKYVYWDGGILKGPDSIYYMFASRWDQTNGHNGWMCCSKAVWATSKNLYGPYTEKGECFKDNGSAGHNVNVIKLKNGDPSGKKYAMTLSGSVGGSGRVYGADSLSGPWSYLGNIQMDMNGYSGRFMSGDNFRVILRPDGKYECLTGRIGISENSILGPYKCQQANDFTALATGSPTVNMEDPNIFYSGGKYHVLYNQWSSATAFSYTSTDGIKFTMDKGYAYQPSSNNTRYTDGTVNHWKLLERPFAYIENGHVVAFTFAAINSEKSDDKPNDQNGSKIIVVPFDGVAFDSGVAPGTVAALSKQLYAISTAITIPGAGTFKFDNANIVERVRFADLLGKKVLEIPVASCAAIKQYTLPYGLYIMSFYGDERTMLRSYKVLVKR